MNQASSVPSRDLSSNQNHMSQVLIRATITVALLSCLITFLPAFAIAQDSASTQWKSKIVPILQDSCLDCHSGDQADGSLDLEAFESLDDVVQQRRLWAKIATRVRDRQMPPEDGPELSEADRKQFLDWADNVLPALPCKHPNHAGSVTIRRLTRYEYANTIRELLKVDYPFTDAFPADEVGYGFDNIGDVLSVSPLLMEKYLAAAETIAESVIFDPSKQELDLEVSADQFEKIRGGHVRDGAYVQTTNGTITIEVKTDAEGRYAFEVDAYGMQAGDEMPKLVISANGKQLREFKVRQIDREEAETYKVEGRLRKGRNQLQLTFANDYYNPKARDRNRRDRNLVFLGFRASGPTSKPKPTKVEKAFLIATPSKTKTARQAAAEVINLHASRAFRRRLYKNERERLLTLFDLGINNGETYQGAMRLVLQAILVSPHFLYKVELPAPENGTPRPLTDYELATTLSYTLWSSMPDDELFRLATQEKLSDPATLRKQVLRMLKDKKAIALVDNFAAQWLQLRLLDEVDPDPDKFPGFTNHLRESMKQETRLLLADVLLKDAPLTTLLTAEYTYVNKALARHYGLKTRGLMATEFTRVELADSTRRGLLTHASVLTLTSNPTRTSPVKRGKWVLENILADPPPPALADVPQLDSQEELKGSLRERMEQHRADPNCAVCHYKMDSLGFALENYDGFGKFREMDDDQVIDAAGELPDGQKFNSAAELQLIIAKSQRKQFVRCIVEKLFVFALGRGPQATDDCIIDQISNDAYANDHRVSDIVLAIVNSEAFRTRSRPVDSKVTPNSKEKK